MAKADRTPDNEIVEAVIAANFRRQIRFWLIAAALLGVFLYVFSNILLPFLAGAALAYFLDPVADRLERLGLSRAASTVVIAVGALLVLVLVALLVVPALIEQIQGLVAAAPDMLARFIDFLGRTFSTRPRRCGATLPRWRRRCARAASWC